MRRISYRTWLHLFPVVVAIHDVEELLTMPRFAREHTSRVLPRLDLYEPRTLTIAMIQIQMLVTGAACADLARGSRATRATVSALVGAFLLNGVMHVGLSAWLRRYTPGLASAVLVVIPATAATLGAAGSERLLTWPELGRRVLAGLGVTGPLIAFFLHTSHRLAEAGRTKEQS